MKIENVILPNKSPDECYDITFSTDQVGHVTLRTNPSGEPASLVLPTLCHPHIHLDKAYLLTSHSTSSAPHGSPDYSDLALQSGDFKEALAKTSEAKTRYTVPDLVLRGSQLIAESIRAGVTSMRAFVEVDHVTRFKCLDAAVELKRKFDHLCYVQICAFAQDPVMSTDHGDENRALMEEALRKYEAQIEVIGTTPYVEENQEKGLENIRWAIQTALERSLHLDFHLDYNLDANNRALIADAVEELSKFSWNEKTQGKKRIVCGHCTRMTLFSPTEMQDLAQRIVESQLPVAFVGLPTSDLFMMGRTGEDDAGYGQRQRGTLQVLDMIQKDKLQACIGVNNVGNAFTPWGSADPLRLASLGVGLYHAGTADHARLLYQCISTRARRAIGLQRTQNIKVEDSSQDFNLDEEVVGGILLVRNETRLHYDGAESVPARQRVNVTDVVWDPPGFSLRKVIRRSDS